MMYPPGAKTTISLAALVLSIAVIPARAAEVEKQSHRIAAWASDVSESNQHLTFPDNTDAFSFSQPVRIQRAVDSSVTAPQAFVPLPSSTWAGLAILLVMVYRKPILRFVTT